MNINSLHRVAAFSNQPPGGNPAGVYLCDRLPTTQEMQRIAEEVGYSETAFVAPINGTNKTVRYFSPVAEVPFCGHATIAAGLVLGQQQGLGHYTFEITAGSVQVTSSKQNDEPRAGFESVATEQRTAPPTLLRSALELLGWKESELEEQFPPCIAFAGAWHLVLVAKSVDRLDTLEYDFEALKQLMLENNLTSLQLVAREDESVFISRNPFPVGGVKEDPATGAAAAAFAGYLRDAGLLQAPRTLLIKQGDKMGCPSRLYVEIPKQGGIYVSGTGYDIHTNSNGT